MVTVQAAIKEYLVECEVRRYTPKTIKGYRTALNIFQQVLTEIGVTDIEDVTMASVKKFQQILVGKKHKGTYINSLLKASKSFISYCFTEEIGGFNTKGRAYPWVKEDKPVIKAFSPKDVRILLGTYVLSSGYYDAYYLRAQKVRTLIRQDFDNAFKQCDVLLTPVTPATAFKFGEKSDPLQMYLSDIFTIALNLSGNCGMSVPYTLDSGGMPIGLQVIAPALAEERLLSFGRVLEANAEKPEFIPDI